MCGALPLIPLAVGELASRLASKLVNEGARQLANQMASDWLAKSLAIWLAKWLGQWLADWLVNWLAVTKPKISFPDFVVARLSQQRWQSTDQTIRRKARPNKLIYTDSVGKGVQTF